MANTKNAPTAAEKKYNIITLAQILNCLSNCTNTGKIKSATMISSIRISRKIVGINKIYHEEKAEIMKSFGVEVTNNSEGSFYFFADKPKDVQKKINDALDTLDKTEYSLEGLNTLDEKEFVLFTQGLSAGDCAFLYEYLVRDTEAT
jgi:hypothetical protein